MQSLRPAPDLAPHRLLPPPAGRKARPRLPAILLLLAWLASTAGAGSAQAALQRWVYCSQNLWVDANLTALESTLRRAHQAGYTHVLIADSKFAKLGDMDARYFRNVDRVKHLAAELALELVPALFSIGYSNDLLWHDPNLIEALPVQDSLLVVEGGVARLQPDPPVALRGGDFANLALWDWKDATVVADTGTARVTDPRGANARIVQKLRLQPFRQYHLSVQVKTADFAGTPEVKLLAGNRSLTYQPLGVKRTQDWQTHHIVFNSLDLSEVNLYLGCWNGSTGTLWWDHARIEEVAFLNLVRRPGAPLEVRHEDGEALVEGADFTPLRDPKMGVRLWPGSYDVYHEPPRLQTSLPDGTRLRASYYHAMTVYDDQAMICPSEPRTLELLRDQARRMHAAWSARGYFMSHDEIRVLNWCAACRRRGLEAGAIVADNVRTCAGILREVNPGGRIYVWSDMFDPHHNARRDYYLVRGDLAGSWEGLDRDVIIVPWYYDKRAASLKFFAERGHRQLIAGYYDAQPERARNWLEAATPYPGIQGIMYTTWQRKFTDLEKFSEVVAAFPVPETWSQARLDARIRDRQFELHLMGRTELSYAVLTSSDLHAWELWQTTPATGVDPVLVEPAASPQAQRFFRALASSAVGP
ncbi:MAG: hypothetical protein FJ387_18780 [Verrucomicrobia bacterium]|nr:hypothetical protein [Verrucomicrobiota bacterium]